MSQKKTLEKGQATKAETREPYIMEQVLLFSLTLEKRCIKIKFSSFIFQCKESSVDISLELFIKSHKFHNLLVLALNNHNQKLSLINDSQLNSKFFWKIKISHSVLKKIRINDKNKKLFKVVESVVFSCNLLKLLTHAISKMTSGSSNLKIEAYNKINAKYSLCNIS
ncbi:hypothetical protein BpHYR1_036051 [Brachionus plicatilis]|uniref:Uncharacterized protein n=1 Tax=Brachionus plicatilis TaxID=10195 RepID=A0A3M7RZJ5_BRAPC|nr:hypothetical protein BpHYR1_036051 [Brachionus plicatilis]